MPIFSQLKNESESLKVKLVKKILNHYFSCLLLPSHRPSCPRLAAPCYHLVRPDLRELVIFRSDVSHTRLSELVHNSPWGQEVILHASGDDAGANFWNCPLLIKSVRDRSEIKI